MSHETSHPIRTYVLVGAPEPHPAPNPTYLHNYEVNLTIMVQGKESESLLMQELINQTTDDAIQRTDPRAKSVLEQVRLHPSATLPFIPLDNLSTENITDAPDFTNIIAKEYRKRGDVHIIRAKPGQSIEDTLKGIKGRTIFIVDAHGGDGNFIWNTDESLYYSHLFNALPHKGVESVIIASCDSGSIEQEKFLKLAPAGTLVLTMTSAHSLNITYPTLDFIDETKHITHPITLFLKVLDNFDPKIYKAFIDAYDKKEDSNPAHETPYLIGIGGIPPMRIDLQSEMKSLATGPRNSNVINEVAWQQAISNVQQNFDTYGYHTDPENAQTSLGPKAEKVLHHKINAIAAKIRRGIAVGNSGDAFQDATELRIAYGLTAAYLDDCGQIRRWQKEQIAHTQLHELEALVQSHSQSQGPANKDALQEIKEFAREFHISLSSGETLTDKDMLALGKALHINAGAAPDTPMITAMEDSIITGHLPTPRGDKSKHRIID